jgi:hypothetical protein
LAFGLVTRVAIAVFVCAILGISGVRPALAVDAKPQTDWSFYIKTADTGTAYNLGCNQGNFDKSFSPYINSLVVLDFGGQLSDGSGTKLVNAVNVTNAQIEAVAEAFAHGYWACTGSDTTSQLSLSIGTNNSNYDVSSSGGNGWAQVVSATRSYLHSQGWDSQVSAGGGNDMEPDYHNASDTRAWVDGYSAVYPAYYVDYGSADGCPTSNPPTPPYNGTCNNGWTQNDEWYVSWGAAPAQALPITYYTVNATQWAMISLYGVQNQSGKIYFYGPLDQNDLDGTTLTSAQAWNALWNALNSAGVLVTMPYSAEVHSET